MNTQFLLFIGVAAYINGRAAIGWVNETDLSGLIISLKQSDPLEEISGRDKKCHLTGPTARPRLAELSA